MRTSATSTQSERTSPKSVPARRPPAVQSTQPPVQATQDCMALPRLWIRPCHHHGRSTERFCLYHGRLHRKLLKASLHYTQRDNTEAWCDWHVKGDLPKNYREHHLTHVTNSAQSTIVAVAALPDDFPFNIEHTIVESSEVHHCVNPQYDARAQPPIANIVMDWLDEGKLDAVHSDAIIKGTKCLGTGAAAATRSRASL